MQDTDQGTCPKCEMAISDGDNPTMSGGQMYCCGGCASGGDCTCSKHAHQASS